MADSNLVQYGSYDVKAAQAEQEQLDKAGNSTFYKAKTGKNVLRFLPPPVGRNSPFIMAHQHYVQLPGMTNSASLNCPRVMGKRACVVCQKVDQLRATGFPVDYDQAGEWMAKLRVYGTIIDRSAPELGPQVFAFGKTIHEPLVKLRADEETGGDFSHPIEGFDIILEKTGEKKNTKYAVRPARNSSPLGDMEWIAIQADLGRYAKVPTDDDVRRILNMKPTGEQAADTGAGRRRTTRTAEKDVGEVDND